MHQEQHMKKDKGRAGDVVNKGRMLAFALLLTVPAVLSGCGQQDECDPDYDSNCEYDSSSGHYYYGGGGGGYYSGSSRSSTSQSGSHSGFGSGSHSSFGG
ncbi:hypothetical protein J22TS3_42240 [Paenibacillus sp. J22TS3]|nr:hypothetical protein J22TS3_42240 [Paenibacillus sp. J22TS3]